MALDVSKEIKRTFDLAGLHQMAAKHLNGSDWNKYQSIREKFENLKRQEEDRYHTEYDTRVEVARKRLIDKNGQNGRAFTWKILGSDKFDKAAIDRQANRTVKDDHHKTMAKLEDREIQAIETLTLAAQHRRQLAEKPKREFEQATDWRSGLDRRQMPPARQTRNRAR